MTHQELTLRRGIDAPVEQVWTVLTDLENAASRLSGVDTIQIMTSGPYAVGTRWRETRTFFGQSATEEMWVRSNDPLRSTVVEAFSSSVAYRSAWRLREIESAKTELTLDFTAQGPDNAVANALSAVLGPLGLRATRKAMEQDIDDIERAAKSLASASEALLPRSTERSG